MGGARFHLVPFEDGAALVRRAYDLGINYFDMARSYWERPRRTGLRRRHPALPQAHLSHHQERGIAPARARRRNWSFPLKLMNTDYVDLWQMHGVNQ